MPSQNMPLGHKNYFEVKAFEFLKSLIFLNVDTPQRIQLPYIPSLGTILIILDTRTQEVNTTSKQTFKTIVPVTYFPKSPFIFPKSHLSSINALSPDPILRSDLFSHCLSPLPFIY